MPLCLVNCFMLWMMVVNLSKISAEPIQEKCSITTASVGCPDNSREFTHGKGSFTTPNCCLCAEKHLACGIYASCRRRKSCSHRHLKTSAPIIKEGTTTISSTIQTISTTLSRLLLITRRSTADIGVRNMTTSNYQNDKMTFSTMSNKTVLKGTVSVEESMVPVEKGSESVIGLLLIVVIFCIVIPAIGLFIHYCPHKTECSVDGSNNRSLVGLLKKVKLQPYPYTRGEEGCQNSMGHNATTTADNDNVVGENT